MINIFQKYASFDIILKIIKLIMLKSILMNLNIVMIKQIILCFDKCSQDNSFYLLKIRKNNTTKLFINNKRTCKENKPHSLYIYKLRKKI